MTTFAVFAKRPGSTDWGRAHNLSAEDEDDAARLACEWLRDLNAGSAQAFDRAELEWSDVLGSHRRVVWARDCA